MSHRAARLKESHPFFYLNEDPGVPPYSNGLYHVMTDTGKRGLAEQPGHLGDVRSLDIQCDCTSFRLHEFQSLHWFGLLTRRAPPTGDAEGAFFNDISETKEVRKIPFATLERFLLPPHVSRVPLNSRSRTAFEKNKTDVFRVKTHNVGPLKKLRYRTAERQIHSCKPLPRSTPTRDTRMHHRQDVQLGKGCFHLCAGDKHNAGELH